MAKPGPTGKDHSYWLYDSLFSIYFALLLVSAHESTKVFSWSIRLRNCYVAHFRPELARLMDDTYRVEVSTFVLIWISAAVVLTCMHFLRRFSPKDHFLRIFVGGVATGGFPLACLYSGGGRLLFLEVELVIATACVVLASLRIWPVSTPLNVLLLILHYSLWSSLGEGFRFVGGWYAFWPGWQWVRAISGVAWLIYPVFGFCLALMWAVSLRQSDMTGQAPQGVC